MVLAGSLCFAPPAFAHHLRHSDPASWDEKTAEYHVDAHGSDEQDGSTLHPFATLDRAKTAMEITGIRRTIVAGGTYRLSKTFVLQSVNSGMIFAGAVGAIPLLEGAAADLATLVEIKDADNVTLQGFGFVNTAGKGAALQLTGGSGHQIIANFFHNNSASILLTGSFGNRILDNTINHSDRSAIELKDSSDGNLIDGNSIDGTNAIAEQGGGIFVHGARGTRITHNLVQNTAGIGIGIANWDNSTINVNTIIVGNIVRNANTQSQDSGAIYMLGRSHVETAAVIADNLIDGTGKGGDAHTIGIYLDDSTTGVLVQNNIVRNIGTHAMQIHGGDRNIIRNNIFDLGDAATSAILFQSAPPDTNPTNTMIGNVVTGNIIVATGSNQSGFTHLMGGTPYIAGNLYFGLTAEAVFCEPIMDETPFFGNPRFRNRDASDYALQPGSASRLIGFSVINTVLMGPLRSRPHWRQ